jgi:hypothetical protein
MILNVSKNNNKHICLTCKFYSNSNSNLEKHISSKKHINNIKNTEILPTDFHCKICDIYYQCNSGLWRHNKTKHFISK